MRQSGALQTVVLGGSPDGARVALVALAAKGGPVTAPELIGPAARAVGGGGGGKDPERATAGGKDPGRLDEALDADPLRARSMIPPGRVLGVDLGSKRIGVAVTDSEQRVATGVAVLARTGDRAADHQALADLAASYEAVGIVVGLPLSLSGRMGPAAEAVAAEVADLQRRVRSRSSTVDERLTTSGRGRHAASRRPSARDQRAVIDQNAAALLLQTWVEQRRGPRAKGRLRREQKTGHPARRLHRPAAVARARRARIPATPPARVGRAATRSCSTLLIVLLLLVALVIGGFVWAEGQINPGGHHGPDVAVRIPTGVSTSKIGDILAQAGVIHDATLFSPLCPHQGRRAAPARALLPPAQLQLQLGDFGPGGRPETGHRHASGSRRGTPSARSPRRWRTCRACTCRRRDFWPPPPAERCAAPTSPPASTTSRGCSSRTPTRCNRGRPKIGVLETLVGEFDDQASQVGLSAAAARLHMTPLPGRDRRLHRRARGQAGRGPGAGGQRASTTACTPACRSGPTPPRPTICASPIRT